MFHWDVIDKERAEEAATRAGYRAPDYTGEPCCHCGRHRVMNCVNGKRICEKCGTDAETKEYDYVFLSF